MNSIPFRRPAGALLLIVGALGGCATMTGDGGTPAAAAATTRPFTSPGGEGSFHVILAEMALAREQYDVAAREYAKAAQLSDDPEPASQATSLAFELGDDEQALASARRWSELSPDDMDARRYLARLYVRTGNVDAAVDELDALVSLSGGPPADAFLPIAALLIEETDYPQRTVRALDGLTGRYEDIPDAHYALGLLALQAGDRETARRAAARATDLAPDWPQAGLLQSRLLLGAGQTEAALALASDIARATDDPTLRLDYAYLLINAGREGEARLELDLLLEEQPRLPGALRAAGLLDLQRDDLDTAQLRFTSLLATGQHAYESFYYLGVIADRREHHRRAIRLYSQVRDGELAVPSQIRAAQLYEMLGEPDASLQHLREFGEQSPRHAVDMSLAAAELLIARGQQENALLTYNEALSRHPDEARLRYGRAFLYERLDRVDEALAELRALADANPDDPIALNALGYTLADRTDRYREAHRLIRRALAMAPDNAAIIDSMGWVMYRRGRLEEAIDYLRQAYALLPDPEIAAHLGEVLYVSGQTDEALQIWNAARYQDPQSEPLRETMRRFGQ